MKRNSSVFRLVSFFFFGGNGEKGYPADSPGGTTTRNHKTSHWHTRPLPNGLRSDRDEASTTRTKYIDGINVMTTTSTGPSSKHPLPNGPRDG